jgi:membrane protease YdiL (CAAX protease family)
MNWFHNHPTHSTSDTYINRPPDPAGWLASFQLFCFPAIGVVLSFYGLRRWFVYLGLSEIISYLIAMGLPLALMFAAALIAFHYFEGRPFTRQAFAYRMRFPRLRWRDLLIGIGIFIVGGTGYFLLSIVGTALIQRGIIPLPANLPIFDDPTAVVTTSVLDQAAGGQIHGQWTIILVYAITYFFNIAGEELWWRGYIFPRQELVFGRFTWLIHGLMWAFFHAFKYWDVLSLLPICLLVAFSAQKFKNNWPGLIGHALMNILGLISMVIAILQ